MLKMRPDECHFKREKLSKSYRLITDYTMFKSGYLPDNQRPSVYQVATKFLQYQFLSHYFGPPPKWRSFLRQISGERTLPDFCLIGPLKSGTSNLAVDIMLHPNVLPPIAKEFDFSDPEDWRIFYPTVKEKMEHAKNYGLALSPFLVPNMHRIELIYNMARKIPDMKIVIVLRDPVDRLYSQWKWEVFIAGKKRINGLSFMKDFSSYVNMALSLYPELSMFSACGFQPLQSSIYWQAITIWIECFGSDNVLVLDANDYFSDNNAFLGEVYDFVGLPSFNIPKYENKVNENPLSFPSADQNCVDKLSEFFRPHNEKLWGVIGKSFKWQ